MKKTQQQTVGISQKYISRSGRNHWNYKGGKVGYTALHDWIVQRCGSANHCEKCGSNKIPDGRKRWFEWSSKTKKYSRDIKKWWQLCVPCHRKYDNWSEKTKYSRRRCWESRERNLMGQFK